MPAAPAKAVKKDATEVTIMTVWPTLGAGSFGRTLGKLYQIKAGGYIFTIGNLLALLSIPIALHVYLFTLLPWAMIRYRLTTRRIIVEKGMKAKEERWAELDRFDTIDIEILPGQEWYHAGDLIFRKGNIETLRLSGVPRPETFRQTCLKAQRSYAGVQKAMAMQKG